MVKQIKHKRQMKSDRYKDRFEFYKAGSKDPHIIINVSQDYSAKGKEMVCDKPEEKKLAIAKLKFNKAEDEKVKKIMKENKGGSFIGDFSDLISPAVKKTAKEVLKEVKKEEDDSELKRIEEEERIRREDERTAENEERQRLEWEESVRDEEREEERRLKEEEERSFGEEQEPDREYNDYVKSKSKPIEPEVIKIEPEVIKVNGEDVEPDYDYNKYVESKK